MQILGDTFVRMLRAAGRNVEVRTTSQYGVQVADVVVGFLHLPDLVEKATRSSDRYELPMLGALRGRSKYYQDIRKRSSGARVCCMRLRRATEKSPGNPRGFGPDRS